MSKKTIHPNLKKFDQMVMQGKATWWQMELPSGKVIFGETKTDMLGYNAEDFTNYQDFTELLHPDDQDKTMQAMRDHLSGQNSIYHSIYRIQKNGGGYLTFYDYGKVVDKKDEKIKLIGFVFKLDKDIEKRKQAIKAFEDLIEGGDTSLLELFGRVKA